MTSITHRALLRPPVAALAMLCTLVLLPAAAQAQHRVGGGGYGSSVIALGVSTRSAAASLPSAGGYDVGETQAFSVANTVVARWLTTVTSGNASDGSEPASAQTISEVENVKVLNGLVLADNVTAIASSYANGSGVGSTAEGSGFVKLVVAGVPVAADVAPNTRIDLPGVGYVVLNEQTRTGDGTRSSGITVNMIRVILLTGGEIIVGSASSSVAP